jgi:hypothetical protein
MIIVVDPNVIALQNTLERINITVQNSAVSPPQPITPSSISLQVMDMGGNPIVSDTWTQSTPGLRIVQSGTGQFYIDFGYQYATLSSSVSPGATSLSVTGALPTQTIAWPTTGTLFLEPTSLTNAESVPYTALSIVNGVGTFTLSQPVSLSHAVGVQLRGPNTETNTAPKDWLFNWQVQLTAGNELAYTLQKVKVITVRSAMFLPDLRQMIDKTHKITDPVNDVFLGYTDSQIYNYLEGGLQNINAYQPSLTLTLENYPLEFKQILIDASLITGVMSQQLYAIDTDIPNYNDQGTAFVIAHQPQLAAFLNQITQRLDKIIPQMKLQLISPGSLHTSAGPNFRLQQLISAAPSGSIFRGVFFAG